jgi:hypothetical protein
MRDREGQVAERWVLCRGSAVDPDTSVFAGGKAVAVYACGLDEDFGAEEVAADEAVAYWGGGGCCHCVLGRSIGVMDYSLGWKTGRTRWCCVIWESVFGVVDGALRWETGWACCCCILGENRFGVHILRCAAGCKCGFLHIGHDAGLSLILGE